MADFQRSYSGFSVFRHGADRNEPFKDLQRPRTPETALLRDGRCNSKPLRALLSEAGVLAQRVRTRVAASPHFLQFGPWKEKERAVRGAALSQFALQVCAFDKGLGKFHFLDKFTVDMYYKQS